MKQSEKIITLMCQNRDRKWWFPPHFMEQSLPKELFVGYEASARFSELARDYPTMFANNKLDKYLYRRIRWEAIDEWLPLLPANLREIVEKYNG